MQNEKDRFKNEFKTRLYRFVLKLIKLIEDLPRDRVCFRLGDQLLRSGTSILANYTEGQAASSRKDFIKYFETSLKSANETKLWLNLMKDANKIKENNASWYLGELNEIANIFASSILTLKGRK